MWFFGDKKKWGMWIPIFFRKKKCKFAQKWGWFYEERKFSSKSNCIRESCKLLEKKSGKEIYVW